MIQNRWPHQLIVPFSLAALCWSLAPATSAVEWDADIVNKLLVTDFIDPGWQLEEVTHKPGARNYDVGIHRRIILDRGEIGPYRVLGGREWQRSGQETGFGAKWGTVLNGGVLEFEDEQAAAYFVDELFTYGLVAKYASVLGTRSVDSLADREDNLANARLTVVRTHTSPCGPGTWIFQYHIGSSETEFDELEERAGLSYKLSEYGFVTANRTMIHKDPTTGELVIARKLLPAVVRTYVFGQSRGQYQVQGRHVVVWTLMAYLTNLDDAYECSGNTEYWDGRSGCNRISKIQDVPFPEEIWTALTGQPAEAKLYYRLADCGGE